MMIIFLDNVINENGIKSIHNNIGNIDYKAYKDEEIYKEPKAYNILRGKERHLSML